MNLAQNYFHFIIVTTNNCLWAKRLVSQKLFGTRRVRKSAAMLYTKLYNKNKNFNYFKAIITSNQQLEKYKEAEKIILNKLDTKRIIPQLYVELGYNYSLQRNDSLATINYDKAILFVKGNR